MKIIGLTLAALLAVVPTVASAQRYDYGHRYDQRYDNRYNQRGYYNNDRRYYNDRRYNYRDNRYRNCRSGSTGTVLGAVAGGLLGRTIDTRGDRTLGTVLGAGGGALAGRAIDRNCR